MYVSPDGTTVPQTGYRFSDSQHADGILSSKSSPSTPNGHYFGPEGFSNSADAANAYQISPTWSDVNVQGQFDTLQLYDQSNQKWNIHVPTSHGNTTNVLEPYTSAYPEFGNGGYPQYITTPNTPLVYDDIKIFEK